MQRVALFSTGIRSDISTDIAIAEQLGQLGLSTVVLASRSGDEARVRANGLDFILYQRHEAAELTAAFMGLMATGDEPVLYLCHAELHREQLVAQARQLPMVVIDAHVSVDRRRGIGPLTSARTPTYAKHPVAWLEWRRMLHQRHSRPAFLAQIDALKQLSRELGVDFDAMATFDHWHPVRFSSLPGWCLAAPELDFPSTTPVTTPHLGPQLASNLVEPQLDSKAWQTLLPWLNDQQTLVYCSFGSLLSDQRLLLEVVRAARLRPDVSWLLGVNGLSAVPDLGELPANVRVAHDVPQRAVLGRASAMVTGAGIATINECIAARVPMVVYSLGVLDQNGNAARVQWHGLGVVGDRINDQAGDILKNLEVARDSTCAANIKVMSEVFQRYADAGMFRSAIQQQLDR